MDRDQAKNRQRSSCFPAAPSRQKGGAFHHIRSVSLRATILAHSGEGSPLGGAGPFWALAAQLGRRDDSRIILWRAPLGCASGPAPEAPCAPPSPPPSRSSRAALIAAAGCHRVGSPALHRALRSGFASAVPQRVGGLTRLTNMQVDRVCLRLRRRRGNPPLASIAPCAPASPAPPRGTRGVLAANSRSRAGTSHRALHSAFASPSRSTRAGRAHVIAPRIFLPARRASLASCSGFATAVSRHASGKHCTVARWRWLLRANAGGACDAAPLSRRSSPRPCAPACVSGFRPKSFRALTGGHGGLPTPGWS
jgi:hypothetical protein